MKIRILFFALVLVVMAGCEKESEKPQEEKIYTLPGLWIGEYKYINPSTSPKYGQHMLYALKPNGTLVAESTDRGNTYYGAGTWTVTSDSLVKCTILYSSSDWAEPVEQIAEMVFDKKTGTMKGTYRTWGGDGTLEMSNVE